jgi:Histone deacetylase domain
MCRELALQWTKLNVNGVAGALDDTGTNGGKNYSVNVPLQEGMDDDSYSLVFEPVMRKVVLHVLLLPQPRPAVCMPCYVLHAALQQSSVLKGTRVCALADAGWSANVKVMEVYQPTAVVMCCGADSLSGDRLGCFNLSLEGHAHCIEFMAQFNVSSICPGISRAVLSVYCPSFAFRPVGQKLATGVEVWSCACSGAVAAAGRRRLHHAQCCALLVLRDRAHAGR